MPKPHSIHISAKCCDSFFATLRDKDGQQVGSEYDDYVPKFFPGDHYGDYVQLEIELSTGKILNWNVPTQEDLEHLFGE